MQVVSMHAIPTEQVLLDPYTLQPCYIAPNDKGTWSAVELNEDGLSLCLVYEAPSQSACYKGVLRLFQVEQTKSKDMFTIKLKVTKKWSKIDKYKQPKFKFINLKELENDD